MSKLVAVAGVCAAAFGSNALAGTVGASDILDIQIWRGGEMTWSSVGLDEAFTNVEQNSDGSWSVSGNWDEGDWISEWSLDINRGDAQTTRGGFELGVVVSNFNFTNTTGVDNEEFQLVISAFVNPLTAPTVMTGSLSGSLNSANPGVDTAVLGVPAGDNMYTALADGVAMRTLVDDSFGLSTTLTDSFGGGAGFNFSNENGPSVASTLGIRHSFTLSADDNVNFVGAFVVQEIPAPGAAALFGLAGLTATRRRR